jgi:hypothetical protein
MTTEEINDAILGAFSQHPAFARLAGSPPFVVHIGGRHFVYTEIEWKCRTSLLKLAEAYPESGEWFIAPETKANLEKQVADFLARSENAATVNIG